MDDELHDYVDTEKEVLLLKLLEDKASTSQLLLALERKAAITLPSVKAVIAQYRDKTSFPQAFLNWIGLQCQPFVSYRAHDLSDSHLDSSTSNDTLNDSHRPVSVSTGTPTSSGGSQKQNVVTDTASTAVIASGAAKPPSKPKKRVTPNAVSSTDSSALLGNIASTPNSAVVTGLDAGRAAETLRHLSLSFSSVAASPSVFNTALVSPAEAGKYAMVSPVISAKKMAEIQSAGEETLTRNGNSDTSFKSMSSFSINVPTINKAIPIPKAADIMKRSAPYSVHLVSVAASALTAVQAVAHMSAVLTSLILNQHISFAHALPLLAKLCSLSLPGPIDNMQVVVKVLEPDRFPTLLLTSELFHLFAIETIQVFLPVLKLLGDRVALGFAESPVLTRFAPTLSAELTGAAEDARGASVYEDVSFSLPDNFIRPFREETDSRNEYKTQAESAAYNERERCFDDFSNLLHDFQVTNRSDVDGSKILSFWRTVMPAAGAKIMALRDCNYSWFATIFVQMLLFHGLNTSSTSSSRPANSSSRDEGLRSLHSPENSSGKSPFGWNSVPASPFGEKNEGIANYDVNKQRKLEVRMGPGGNGTFNGVRRPQTRGKQPTHTSAPRASPTLADTYEDPALHFSGNQQFFFRFIVQMDNNRFCRCLEDAVAQEINVLCGKLLNNGSQRIGDRGMDNNTSISSPMGQRTRASSYTFEGDDTTSSSSSSSSSSSTSFSSSFLKSSSRDRSDLEHFNTREMYGSSVQSFALRTVKLRLLGKFLGLLTFWPQWLLTVSPGETGPLNLLAASAARMRGALRPATSYPIRLILEQAWVSSRLAYTVPWVVEFLKMIVWDCTYKESYNPYREVFGLLSSMQRSELLHPIKGKPSSNRLYVLIEIQNLWIALSLSDIELTPLPISKNKNTKNDYPEEIVKIDEQNTAFSLSFLHHVTTFLNETVNVFKKRLRLNLAKRSPMPFSVSTAVSLPASVSAVGVAFSTTKRVTPNFVGSLNNSAVSAQFPLGTFTGLLTSPTGGRSESGFSSPSSKTVMSVLPVSSVSSVQGGGSDEEIVGQIQEGGRNLGQIPDLGRIVGQNGQEIPGLPKGIVATSLMAQFSAAVAVRKPKAVTVVAGDKKKDALSDSNVSNVSNVSNASPVTVQLSDLRKLMTAEAIQSRSPLPPSSPSTHLMLPLSAGKAPRGRAITSSSSSSSSSSAASTSITPLAGRSSHIGSPYPGSSLSGPSPSRGLTSTLISLDTLLTPSTAASAQHDSTSLTDRLEVAFWQQHPPLQHISGFLLEHLQQACYAHLKDRVADAVRTLWSRFASLKMENKQLVDAEHLRSVNLTEEEKHLSGVRIADIVGAFPAKLEAEKDSIHSSTVSEAGAFLESFMETHVSVALPELCALHPCHARVTSLSVWLIRKQATAQRGALMSFLSSYSRRKLGEVSSISAKQFKKAMDGLSLQRPVRKGDDSGTGTELSVSSTATSPISGTSLQADGVRLNKDCGSSRRNDRMRREEMSSCFSEINIFFALNGVIDDCSQGSDSEASPLLDIDRFTNKVNDFFFKSISSGGDSSSFQNCVARMCEAVHALVEALAACVGDRVADELHGVTTNGTTAGGEMLSFPCLATSLPTSRIPSGTINSTSSRPTSSYLASASYLPTPPPGVRAVPPKVPSWGPVGSAKLVHDISKISQVPQTSATTTIAQIAQNTQGKSSSSSWQSPLSKPPLTSLQVAVAIENTRNLFMSLLQWAAGNRVGGVDGKEGTEWAKGEDRGVYLLKGSESAGKFSIQIVKLMTSCMPSLFYFDTFLAQENMRDKPDKVASHCVNPFSVYRGAAVATSTDDVRTEWEMFLASDRATPYLGRERNGQHPSAVLIAAEALNVITSESLSFVMVATARPSTLAYYTACKDLPAMKEIVPDMIRSFIGRYYLSLYLKEKDPRTALIAQRVFKGLCEGDDWLEMPAVRSAVGDELGTEMTNLILKLKK